MRTSKDQYKLRDGSIVELDQMTQPPQGAIIWNGYDYAKQCWIYEGQKDTRTLEELKKSLKNTQ